VFYNSQLEFWELKEGHMQGVGLDQAEGLDLVYLYKLSRTRLKLIQSQIVKA